MLDLCIDVQGKSQKIIYQSGATAKGLPLQYCNQRRACRFGCPVVYYFFL